MQFFNVFQQMIPKLLTGSQHCLIEQENPCPKGCPDRFIQPIDLGRRQQDIVGILYPIDPECGRFLR
jgi:hypothetical protein